MTSNERKIINFLREAEEGAHIRDVAQKTNFSSDYARLLCHSLARAGYIQLEDSNICRLLEKGRGHFEDIVAIAEKLEPVIVTANEEGNADQSVKDEELNKALAEAGISYPFQKNEEVIGSILPQIGVDEKPEVVQTEPQITTGATEIEEEKKEEHQEEIGKIEEKPTGNPAPVTPSESPEKIAPKDEFAKPSGGLDVILKKIVNWFTQKK